MTRACLDQLEVSHKGHHGPSHTSRHPEIPFIQLCLRAHLDTGFCQQAVPPSRGVLVCALWPSTDEGRKDWA